MCSVAIEVLDSMKKGKDNFPAREVIKFLEQELKDGSKFIHAQQPNETLSPGVKKPANMDLDIWYSKYSTVYVHALYIHVCLVFFP